MKVATKVSQRRAVRGELACLCVRGDYGRTCLAFTVGPEVDDESDNVVDGGVGALVEQSSEQSDEREQDETGLDAAVEGGAGNEAERPVPGEHDETGEEVEDLEDRHRLDGAVEVLGQKVPEDFGPEEAVDGGGDLV